MPTKRGERTEPRSDDLIHSWMMDRAFGLSAWLDLCAAASGLEAAQSRFGALPQESRCGALRVFNVACAEHSITLHGATVTPHGTHRTSIANDDLVIHRYSGHARNRVNTAGRPHEPVIRALLAMAVHFGNGFRIIATGADRQDWHETECLVSMLLGVDVCGIHPDEFPLPSRKITGPSGPEGAWAVPLRGHARFSQTLAAA